MRVETDRYRKYIDNFDTIESEGQTYTVESTMRGNDYINSTFTNEDDRTYIFWDDTIHNTKTTFTYKCCQNCPNNPDNGGSGICHCVLPSMEMIRF